MMEPTSYSFELLAHSDPRQTLYAHLTDTSKLCREILWEKRINIGEIGGEPAGSINLTKMEELAFLIGAAHDFGKATNAFQQRLKCGTRSKEARHSLISACFGFFVAKQLCEGGHLWRHAPLYAFLTIAGHHGCLQNPDESGLGVGELESTRTLLKDQIDDMGANMNELRAIYKQVLSGMNIPDLSGDKIVDDFIDRVRRDDKNLIEEIRGAIRPIRHKPEISHYLLIMLFYSLLLSADKLDSAGIAEIDRREEILPKGRNLEEYLKTLPVPTNKAEKMLYDLRKEAFQEVQQHVHADDLRHRIYSINLPTGIGKTLTGFGAALTLRESIKQKFGFTPRIIYALPFLSITDQNSKVLREALKHFRGADPPTNLLMEHTHLSELKYQSSEKIDEKEDAETLSPSKANLMIEGWHSEIVITTFVQLFHSLITNRGSAARKFHNIVNSILILDEVQSIPPKYWGILRELIERMCKAFNIWVIVMTATEPLLFPNAEQLADQRYYFKVLNRYEVQIWDEPSRLEDFKEELKQRINDTEDNLMVVCNTVKCSKDLYRYIQGLLKERKDAPLIFNLNTTIIPEDRLKRIEEIKSLTDEKTQSSKRARVIVVTTQLIEAGVDIDMDTVYRDFAPFDSIVQSAGRCNRNSKRKKGQVIVVNLTDKHDQLFSNHIYDRLLLDATTKVLSVFGSKKRVEESKIVMLGQRQYYNKVNQIEDIQGVQNELKECIEKLWFNRLTEFQLIEHENEIDILIEKDKRVTETVDRIVELQEQLKKSQSGNKYDVLASIEQEKRKLAKYMISLPDYRRDSATEALPSPKFSSSPAFKFVPMDRISEYYDSDTGYQTDETQDYEIIGSGS